MARPMINTRPDELARQVLGYTGGAAIKSLFGIDTRTYGWVKDFVRDEKTRKEIKNLQEKIVETKALPIHKDELRKMFEDQVEKINSFRLEQLKWNLSAVQLRQDRLIDELYMDSTLVLGARFYPFLMSFSSENLEEIFSELPEGVKQKDIDQTVKRCQAEIKRLKAVIERDLNPQSRWFHADDGNRAPYPLGCRWTPFVETWRKVVSRYIGKVNIEGEALETTEEVEAYHLLELDSVRKVTPLKEPYR